MTRGASVCVLNPAFFGGWIRLHRDRRDRPLPDALDLLVDHCHRPAGEHDDWDEYRAAMRRGSAASSR